MRTDYDSKNTEPSEKHFIIDVRSLSKKYGDHFAVYDLNLKVADGEIFGFLGHNGAGKTTTVNMLTTLLQPTSGSAFVAGFDILKESVEVRKRIGYLPENVPQKTQDTQNNGTNQVKTLNEIPDNAKKLLGIDPLSNDTDGDGVDDMNDSTPTLVDVPPKPSTGPVGFRKQSIIDENNYDEIAKKDAPDHLELVLQSTTSKDISNMTAYYVITDAKINKTESYIKPLNGFVLKADETRTIHFDAGQKPDHFRANPNSIYYTTKDELNFTVTINADGYAAQTILVKKDAGGAETPD